MVASASAAGDHASMQPEVEARLEEGRGALEAGDWQAARAAFHDVLAVDEVAEALDGCALALRFLGELEEGSRSEGARSPPTSETATSTTPHVPESGSRASI